MTDDNFSPVLLPPPRPLPSHPLPFILQVICEKIFRPWFSPTLLGAKAGLPLQVELQKAVQECSETDRGEEEEEQRGERRSLDVQQHLHGILTRLLKEGGVTEEGGATERTGHAHTSLNF